VAASDGSTFMSRTFLSRLLVERVDIMLLNLRRRLENPLERN